MLNRAFITKTTSGELGFRNRKSTRDDLLLTDVGVRFPQISAAILAEEGVRSLKKSYPVLLLIDALHRTEIEEDFPYTLIFLEKNAKCTRLDLTSQFYPINVPSLVAPSHFDSRKHITPICSFLPLWSPRYRHLLSIAPEKASIFLRVFKEKHTIKYLHL